MKIKSIAIKNVTFPLFLLSVSLLLITYACAENSEKPSAIANPAARKCVNDGFTLKPVIVNGVTKEYLCVNPQTGEECEVWKYFRDECDL